MERRQNTSGTDHAVMRELNRSLILDVVKRGDGPVSRAAISRETGLAKPTVSAIVDDLIEVGLIRELGPGQSARGGGRPPILLEYNARSRFIAGMRVGVGRTHIVVADGRGEELDRVAVATPEGEPLAALAKLGDALRDLLKKSSALRKLDAIGICIPGLVDMETGICLLAPNLGWRDVPVSEVFGERFGVPVYAINTAQAAIVVENLEGAAQGVDNAVLLYVGLGVGSAVLSEGRLLHGVSGLAGEIGHCHVPGGTIRCNCGKVGCLETLTDGFAIVRHALAAIRDGRASALNELDPARLQAGDVADAAAAGDELATEIFHQAGTTLGLAASWLINLFNPEVLLVGGGVAEAGELLLGPLRSSAMQHALPQAAERVHIRSWRLGRDAAVMGAVRVAMQNSETYYRVIFQG